MIRLRIENSIGGSSLAGSEHIEILRRGPGAWLSRVTSGPALCAFEGLGLAFLRQGQFDQDIADLRPQQFVDSPADVHWTSAYQVLEAEPGTAGNQQHFESLREAIDFVMQELTIADRANVWVTTEHGNLTVEQIEKTDRSKWVI
jgi:hypothetical protein